MSAGDVPDLVGAAEVCERLGISLGVLHNLRVRASHHAFPPPLVRLKSGPVWAWPDVERFMEAEEVRKAEAEKAARAKLERKRRRQLRGLGLPADTPWPEVTRPPVAPPRADRLLALSLLAALEQQQ